jgi:arginine-tRNA-protein transferase
VTTKRSDERGATRPEAWDADRDVPVVEFAHGVEPPRPCSYLPDRLASTESRVLLNVSSKALGHMLVRGWRRFGPVYFRPACRPCGECVSLRIPVDRFRPTTSQRRAARRCAALSVTWGRPRVDDERLALLSAWHREREAARGWQASGVDAESYGIEFAMPHPAAREAAWRDGDRLVAVSLVDETPAGLSAVYFYYHPDVRRLSPGVANVVMLVARARQLGLPHVYLGYRVLGCASLAYKASFAPHELLEGRPAASEAPAWRPPAG